MYNYIVCRHETAGEVVYGLTLTPDSHNILHIGRDELFRRVSQGVTGVFFTATNGKHGAPISAVEGHLVVNHVRTQSNSVTSDNLGDLDACDYVHDPKNPLKGFVHNRKK